MKQKLEKELENAKLELLDVRPALTKYSFQATQSISYIIVCRTKYVETIRH